MGRWAHGHGPLGILRDEFLQLPLMGGSMGSLVCCGGLYHSALDVNEQF